MAGFDPADFEDVAPASDGGGMDPSEFEEVKAPAHEYHDVVTGQKLEHGPGQTFVRKAVSLLSSGISDEIAGWIDAAIEEHGIPGDEAYRQHRDKYRALTKQGEEENPRAAMAGTAAGIGISLLTGKPTAPVSLGRAALRGAGTGAAYGLGESEADLTRGEWGKAAWDAAIGASTGAAVGAAGQKLANWMKGAPVREEVRELAGLKDGIQYSTKLKTFGKATPQAPEGQFTEAIKRELKAEPAIAKAAQKSPSKAMQLVDTHVSKLSERLDDIYEKAQDASPGVPLTTVLRSLHRIEKEYEKKSATAPLAKQVAGVIEHLRDTWGQHNVVKNVGQMPFQALREEYRAWQDVANRASKVFSAQSPREEVSEAMANAMREALQVHVDKVATRNPSLGISRKLLEETNGKVSTWLKVQRALTEKVTRENVGAPTMGEAIATIVNPKKLASAAAKATVPVAERIADPRMAKLARLAESGDRRAAALFQFMTGKSLPALAATSQQSYRGQMRGDGLYDEDPAAEAPEPPEPLVSAR